MIRILSWIPGVYPSAINNLPLPASYLQIERMGRWTIPRMDTLADVFGEEATNPCFYGRDFLGVQNKDLAERISNDEYFLGKCDGHYLPGDILPNKVIFIGDLGIDRPIALDYRNNFYEPRVIYLKWTTHGSRWVSVADTFDELVLQLGLKRSANSG